MDLLHCIIKTIVDYISIHGSIDNIYLDNRIQ